MTTYKKDLSPDRYVVAVSGGVDSVVLLDMLAQENTYELVVAHFDHGIRDDSADDAAFVADLAKKYGLSFESAREELGASASEDLARQRRYAFLQKVAKKYDATIATAHHMNDIAETIAINLTRGTGWRGLACLASEVYRPLLSKTKAELVHYAQQHRLEWREDSTNQSDVYLRNRIRSKVKEEDLVLQLAALRARQLELRQEIDEELSTLDMKPPFSRHFFTMTEQPAASECLRKITHGKLTRPQRERALLAIATYKPGLVYQAGSGVELSFSVRSFTIRHPDA